MNHWRIEQLNRRHLRECFDCGVISLNVFLTSQASQNARRDISRTYVATEPESDHVAGYYTLSSGSISFAQLPDFLARRLPKYPVPAVHLGRLAVDVGFQGKGLGRMLLFDACRRVCSFAEQVGVHAVSVHALDDVASDFYRTHGFIDLLGDARHLILPMATIRKAIGS